MCASIVIKLTLLKSAILPLSDCVIFVLIYCDELFPNLHEKCIPKAAVAKRGTPKPRDSLISSSLSAAYEQETEKRWIQKCSKLKILPRDTLSNFAANAKHEKNFAQKLSTIIASRTDDWTNFKRWYLELSVIFLQDCVICLVHFKPYALEYSSMQR